MVLDMNFFFVCFVLQKQLEDYLNKLLKMQMYRNHHATVRSSLNWTGKVLEILETSWKHAHLGAGAEPDHVQIKKNTLDFKSQNGRHSSL